jgi:hypothetical protein
MGQDTAVTESDAGAQRRLRLAIFVDHDIVYRHFIQSGAFVELVARHDVTIVAPALGPANKRLTTDIATERPDLSVEWIKVDVDRVTSWRRLFQISQLRWRPGADWAAQRAVVRYTIGPKASLLFTALAFPGVYQLARRSILSSLAAKPSSIAATLERLRPDILLHPTVLDGYFINDVVMLGRTRGIPTVAIMNSWDNPSTKRAMTGNPDWLLVWGRQTRDHAIKYMGIDPARAVPFGAAQFDVYRRAPRISREKFCQEHDIDPRRRLLLYAGSSKGSDEFAHLCRIDDAIDAGELADVTVVYRPHPWGRGGYKGERLLDHPWRNVRIERSMRRYLEQVRAGAKAVYLADYAETHDVLSSIDALVSPLSTIILEGALHGKPALCFLPDERPGSSLRLQSRHVHFEDMYRSPMVIKADGDAQLVPKLIGLMKRVGDPDFARICTTECAHFVQPLDEPYPLRLARFIEGIAATLATGHAPRRQLR